MMPEEPDKKMLFFGYTKDELGTILIKLDKHYNYHEKLDWFKQNAPDQTYVNERTVFGVIDNFKHLNLIKYSRIHKTCVVCNQPYFADDRRSLYCSDDCQKLEYKNRIRMRKENPDYKRSVVQIPANTPYIIKQKTTYEDSLNMELTGNDSLFCDTDFLERILGKKLKKTDDCK